jgi:geranylgeranyl pyrophosphate synthase
MNKTEELRSILTKAYNELTDSYTGTTKFQDTVKYVLEGSGKKVRPLLCMLATDALDGDVNDSVSSALALEMIHTYSLVHDDLPCMDDDDLRRGRPTAHVEFDEASAVLAGDALLTDAFHVVSTASNSLSFETKLNQITMLSQASGSKGMVLGQGLDMEHTGKGVKDPKTLDSVHVNKTGALLGASLGLGALSAKKGMDCARDFYNAGEKVGLAFQILDDLLDDSSETGKSAGKDIEAGKLTYLSVMTREEAIRRAEELTSEATSLISSYTKSQDFINFIVGLLERKK